MNSKQRLLARLKGSHVDYVPNTNIIMLFSAKQNGFSYKKYVTDYKTLVECDIKTSEKFGLDLLCVISDPMREAAAFGTKVEYPENGVPYCPQVLLESLDMVESLRVTEASCNERLADRVNGVMQFKKLVGEDYAVAGWVEGAFAESCDLRGMDTLFMDLYEEEEKVHELLKICTLQAISFAYSQIDAGADIIGIGDAACSLISPEKFRNFALPYQKQIISAIHSRGAKTKLHICGNTTALLNDLATTGTDILDLDVAVDMIAASKILTPAGIAISGNFDPVAKLLQGNAKDIEETIRYNISVMPQNYLVSAGCEVPPNTPVDNLMAVKNSIGKF